MNRSIQFLGVTTIFLSTSLYAVDNPQDYMGAQKYDKQQCIGNATQICINSTCLNSDRIDCQDNCAKLAQQKCQQEANE